MPGDARTSISGVALLHFYDGTDGLFRRPLRSWFPSATGRIQKVILSRLQCVVEMEQGGWLDDDCWPNKPSGVQEE